MFIFTSLLLFEKAAGTLRQRTLYAASYLNDPPQLHLVAN
jgi:hypothetical protein